MSTKKYTMVELLVVVGILAILIGIAIPSVGYARKRASITQAKADIANIVLAVKAYESTYNLLPVETTDNGDTGTTIKGNSSSSAYETLIGLLNSTNMRKKCFLELPQNQSSTSFDFRDPFITSTYTSGARYNIIFNSSYNSEGVALAGSRWTGTDRLRGSVFVYSFGPNGEDDDGEGDDITSWDNQ